MAAKARPQECDKMINRIKAFIPRHIANRTVLAVYDILRRFTNQIPENKILQNISANSAEFKRNIPYYFPKKIKYIENQADWGNIRFGSGKSSSMSYSGCGIIAVYNALAALRCAVSADSMVELISHFERDGAAMNGNFGTAPSAMYDYFIRNGFKAVFTRDNNTDTINKIGENYDAVIVTAYNNQTDITEMIHTVCITKREDSGYVIHNGYYKGDGGKWEEKRTGMDTLAGAITCIGVNSAAISVIGIAVAKQD